MPSLKSLHRFFENLSGLSCLVLVLKSAKTLYQLLCLKLNILCTLTISFPMINNTTNFYNEQHN